MKYALTTAGLVWSAAQVAAHGGVTSIGIGGTVYPGWQPYNSQSGQSTAGRPYASFDPILNPVASTMHCNNNGNAASGQKTLTIAAGDTITSYYTQWTHAEGPYTVYLAACPSSGCDSVNSGSVKWFKIYELGLISGTLAKGSWANGLLMKNLKWDAVIPSNLKAGYYLIRWETLALHQANTPQFYPECAQLQITGGGSAFPTSEYLVSIPGAWSASDPGVMVDIYSSTAPTITTYSIPGPRIYPGFSGVTIPTGPATTAAPVTTDPPASTPATSARPTTTSVPSTGGAAHYAQCGGQGWSGATTCASPYTCTKVNDYYYQCL
ncbi:glycoside hydrolase family 61 protein [Ceratobasidium sp. AG-Ba]|nr:glycoside hydrolase family 61 protein [Ceratobasidium sp. AG-Ba]